MINNTITNIEQISEQIFELAHEAMLSDEVPVASVVCMNTNPDVGKTLDAFINGENITGMKIIGEGINQIVNTKDPTAHGEMLALRRACRELNSERLANSFIITTLEPCIMCAGSIILARLEAVVYFAPTQTGLGMAALFQQNPDVTHAFNHYPKLHHLKEYENRASEMLRSFFRLKRSP